MAQKKKFQTIRLLLGDQLNEQHSWFDQVSSEVLYVVAELHQETNYVRHHVQKVCAFFAAMEAFAERLGELGHQVQHFTLKDTEPYQDLLDFLSALAEKYGAAYVEYQQPDEFRLHEQLSKLSSAGVAVNRFETEHFYLSHDQLPKYFQAGKSHKMEMFYRKMRKEQNILMQDDKPLKDKWNFDQSNRNKLKAADVEALPAPRLYSHNVKKYLKRISAYQIETIGKPVDTLAWPVTRAESLDLLEHFCNDLLVNFGTFQDAMTCQSEHSWSLYHSRVSFSLNAKLISPREVVEAAVKAYESNKLIDIAQVEGFVRQILGWREFIRGIYWANMPEYATYNSLHADRSLPDFFWNGETKMNCMSHAISQSLDHAYAHHIQRLMVTGTFSMLAGIHPDEVDNWYLGIYIDALEWVEMPNTRGMSQAADNGIVATKPYAASGNYINKMSDYCGSCFYKVKEKTGDKSCPFNSLYWHFMQRHRGDLDRNPRIGMVYRTWDKMQRGDQRLVLDRAEWCLENLNSL